MITGPVNTNRASARQETKLSEGQQLHLLLIEQKRTNELLQKKEDRRRNWIIFKLLFWTALILGVIVLIFIYAPAYTGSGK